MFSLFPPVLRFSHIISGLFDNYGQTVKKIITKAPTVAEASTIAKGYGGQDGGRAGGQAKDSYYPKKLPGLYGHEFC